MILYSTLQNRVRFKFIVIERNAVIHYTYCTYSFITQTKTDSLAVYQLITSLCWSCLVATALFVVSIPFPSSYSELRLSCGEFSETNFERYDFMKNMTRRVEVRVRRMCVCVGGGEGVYIDSIVDVAVA